MWRGIKARTAALLETKPRPSVSFVLVSLRFLCTPTTVFISAMAGVDVSFGVACDIFMPMWQEAPPVCNGSIHATRKI